MTLMAPKERSWTVARESDDILSVLGAATIAALPIAWFLFWWLVNMLDSLGLVDTRAW